ncbi:MAG: thioesterase family protein [Candidatus Azotimanducaceae bacterium WSBS_2022_MAG_OTU7]
MSEAANEQLFMNRFSAVPFQKELGLEIVSVDGSTITAKLENRPGLMGNEHTGILHGGVVASMIDSVGGFVAGQAARLRLQEKGEPVDRIQKIATVDMRVDYLSPGRGEQFFVTGRALKVGSRFVSTRMEVTDENDQLIAAGSANFLY